jgi:hypothetical protein
VKEKMDLPQIAGVGSEYFLLGFFLFIAFYIIVRLLAEKQEHKKHKIDTQEKPHNGLNNNNENK